VSVNGHLTSSFPLNRGTRQGDPISPTLFVISIEALNHLLLRDSVLRGLMISPMHRVKVLLYADDIALFTATLEELSHALELIRHFCEAVAMKVSSSKSKCLPLKWNPRFPLPYQIVDRQHPERYLGYLFNPEGQTSATSSLISNITTTLTKLKQPASPSLPKLLSLRHISSPGSLTSFSANLKTPTSTIRSIDCSNGSFGVPHRSLRRALLAWP